MCNKKSNENMTTIIYWGRGRVKKEMGLTWVNFNKSTLSKFYQLEQCACLKMVHVNTLKGGGGELLSGEGV